MKVIRTALPGVLLLEPKVFGDARGFFFESYNKRAFQEATGADVDFVQDNCSRSAKNVLRGLHYQIRHAQGKLIRVCVGEVFDLVVDVRKSSATFGQHAAYRLSAERKCMAWVPPGFAHGFLVLSDYAELLYKTTDYWFPEFERTIAWNDPDLGIVWPLAGEPRLSAKDKVGARLKDAEVLD
jgi:dTDP-4-dehydrorhamnose 3,5-epimerase